MWPGERAVSPLQEYESKKASDPEFYRSADSLLYGKDVKDSEDRIERMVAELNDQCAASQSGVFCVAVSLRWYFIAFFQ